MEMRAWFLPVLLLASASLSGPPAQFEDVGTFTGRGYAMSMAVGPGPDDAERLYASYTYPDSQDIVAYDLRDGSRKTWRFPEGGAWAMELGPDGRIYVGTYDHGHILRLDPKSGQLVDLGQVDPNYKSYQIVWDLSTGPDGMIYGSVSPKPTLFRVEPATGKITTLGIMDESQAFLRTLCAAPDGWVYGAIGSEKAGLVAYSPATRERRDLIPDKDRKPGFGYVERGEDGFAYGTCAGVHYRLRDGAATPIDKLPPKKSKILLRNGREAYPPGGWYPGRDIGLYRVAAGPDGNVYAGSLMPPYLLRFDPKTNKRDNLCEVPGGDMYSLLAAHGKVYMVCYPRAILWIYDPARPIKPGQTRQSNPSYYGPVAPDQEHPYGIALGPDDKVYVACLPAYGHYGGALAWHDPQTDTVDYVPTPVEDQGIVSVCTLPDHLLACGTSVHGGPGTTPRAKEGRLFLWDPATKQKIFECVPVPGAKVIANLVVGGDGLVYGSAGEYLATASVVFAFDPRARKVVSQTKLKQGEVTRAGMLTLDDGRVVALAGSSADLIRYANGDWQTKEIARWNARIQAGKAVVDGWIYAAGDDHHLVRCHVPPPD